jgi:hypothetical protein
MKGLMILCSLVAVLSAVLFVSQATMGVFLVGCACWLAINARLYQADEHQKDLLAKQQEIRQAAVYICQYLANHNDKPSSSV